MTVGVRVRPPLAREIENKSFNNCVAVDSRGEKGKIYVSLDDKPVILGNDGSSPAGVAGYAFDHCFNSDST